MAKSFFWFSRRFSLRFDFFAASGIGFCMKWFFNQCCIKLFVMQFTILHQCTQSLFSDFFSSFQHLESTFSSFTILHTSTGTHTATPCHQRRAMRGRRELSLSSPRSKLETMCVLLYRNEWQRTVSSFPFLSHYDLVESFHCRNCGWQITSCVYTYIFFVCVLSL